MEKERLAIIIIDCVRFEQTKYFNFKGFQKLNKVIAVSNWTMPVLASMLTGLHPSEHKCCLHPYKENNDNVAFLQSISSKNYSGVKHHMLLDEYKYKAITEIPVFDLLSQYGSHKVKNIGGFDWIRMSKDPINDKNVGLFYLHLKGGHSSYVYIDDKKESYENQGKEVKALSEKLNPFVKNIKNHFDKVVIAIDHGELWKEVDQGQVTRGHGNEFGLKNLHAAVWLYPNPNLPDELYDSTLVYKFLKNKQINSKQLVLSMSPAYGTYNRFAITYLKNNKLYSENYATQQGWDLK